MLSWRHSSFSAHGQARVVSRQDAGQDWVRDRAEEICYGALAGTKLGFREFLPLSLVMPAPASTMPKRILDEAAVALAAETAALGNNRAPTSWFPTPSSHRTEMPRYHTLYARFAGRDTGASPSRRS